MVLEANFSFNEENISNVKHILTKRKIEQKNKKRKLLVILSFLILILLSAIFFYSLLNARTGSCLAAFLDGIIPPINVNIVLNIISTILALNGKIAVMSLFLVTV